ncbi:MAG: alpha-amylase [Planctomycetota bacterium]|nr:MAG: alpha-amylase [Planctomycetota bacterium]
MSLGFDFPPALGEVYRSLERFEISGGAEVSYFVPSLWLREGSGGRSSCVKVEPVSFFRDRIRAILDFPGGGEDFPAGDWSPYAVVYNMMVRVSVAFDHDGDGVVSVLNRDGFRETGTFLKAIAFLPYLRSMGVNAVHLLPITAVGKHGAKGDLGSPYAIKNPFRLDELLGEPLLGLDLETQFLAFVEAAHWLGMKVVLEFVLRTSARDSDWVKEHPEWYYWILEARDGDGGGEGVFGAPEFSEVELEEIRRKVLEEDFRNLPPPSEFYRGWFTSPPSAEDVLLEGEEWRGVLKDGRRVKIPPAFADWPPDDIQPPWEDVTYLKLHTHPDFNYMAYNTLRMYDERLREEGYRNEELWQRLGEVIPYYQERFGIDGVMLDMGHALPAELKAQMMRKAKREGFVFWDENFELRASSQAEGYSAVVGHCWADQHREEFVDLLERIEREGVPVPFFATPETHNTPRAASREGGRLYSKFALTMNAFLPAILFIHSGFELFEEYPINTGLGFTREELERYPSERLPLFSAYAFAWEEGMGDWISEVVRLRRKYLDLVVDSDAKSFFVLRSRHRDMIGFCRYRKGGRGLVVVGNRNFSLPQEGKVWFSFCQNIREQRLRDYFTQWEVLLALDEARRPFFHVKLRPGQCMVFEVEF